MSSRRALVVLALLSCLLVLWSLAANARIDEAARARVFSSAAEVAPRTTAIVLGARVYPDGTMSPLLADRVACALTLYRAGKVQNILVSGDHGKSHYDESNTMVDAVLAAGVDARVVFRDHAGFRTLDTMQRARAVFAVDSAVVCTQRFHLPRSLYLARHFGIDALGLVADLRADPYALHNGLRERVAHAAALFDVLIGRSARFLGPRFPIDGDGRATQDR